MPLCIAVDDAENKVWYVSTKKGLLGSYNIEEEKFDKELVIPEWKSRESAREFSQVWDIEIDDRREGEEEISRREKALDRALEDHFKNQKLT
jgi:hypothetical protein